MAMTTKKQLIWIWLFRLNAVHLQIALTDATEENLTVALTPA